MPYLASDGAQVEKQRRFLKRHICAPVTPVRLKGVRPLQKKPR